MAKTAKRRRRPVTPTVVAAQPITALVEGPYCVSAIQLQLSDGTELVQIEVTERHPGIPVARTHRAHLPPALVRALGAALAEIEEV